MMNSGLTILGDWKSDVKIGLDKVLIVSMDVCGRNGEQACRHAMIMMAESARAMTRVAPTQRPVASNPGFRHLLRKGQYKKVAMKGNRMSDYYRFTADKLGQPPPIGKASLRILYANQKQKIAKIGNRNIARKSWFWGLNAIGKSEGSKPIEGASEFLTILGKDQCGYIKRNKLSYILRALPAGWASTLERNVTSKFMYNAVRKLQDEWRNRIGLFHPNQNPTTRQLADYFRRAS